jgi:hypothetical protein
VRLGRVRYGFRLEKLYGEKKMKKIECEITGVAGLLQHRFQETGANSTKAKKKVYDPEEEADKASYRNQEGEFYIPSEHILGALIKAGVQFKYEGKKTYKEIVKAGVIVCPDCVPLLDKEGKVFTEWDEIDQRAVVVQRSRITRWRPKFNEWKLKFTLEIINDDEVAPSTLKEILEYAGRIGVGDYRPRFGRFQVTEWKVLE